MIYEISIRGAFGCGNRFWLEQKSRSTFRRVCVSSLYLFLYTRSHLRFKLLSKKESLCTTQSKESPSKEAYGMQCMFAFEPNIPYIAITDLSQLEATIFSRLKPTRHKSTFEKIEYRFADDVTKLLSTIVIEVRVQTANNPMATIYNLDE